MLVLSRERDETIRVHVPGLGHVDIKVVDVRGDKVRLGVKAPSRAWIVERVDAEGASETPELAALAAGTAAEA